MNLIGWATLRVFLRPIKVEQSKAKPKQSWISESNIFQSKVNRDCTGFAFLISVIDLKNSHQKLNHSDGKLKPITTWLLLFFRASENFLVVTLSSHWLSGMPPHWSNVTSRAVTWCCLLHITEGFWPRSLSVITVSDLFPSTEKVISSGSACYSVLKGSNFEIWDINISFFCLILPARVKTCYKMAAQTKKTRDDSPRCSLRWVQRSTGKRKIIKLCVELFAKRGLNEGDKMRNPPYFSTCRETRSSSGVKLNISRVYWLRENCKRLRL